MADILVQGLTQNNLKHVTFQIPKEKITVFTGVSGSGKSSIVFDTIAAEAQRQMIIPRLYGPDCPNTRSRQLNASTI